MRVLDQQSLDMEFLEFSCSHDLIFLSALTDQIEVPQYDWNGKRTPPTACSLREGQKWSWASRLCLNVLDMQLTVPCIANLLAVSKRTVFKRMAECNVSVRGPYCTVSNEKLDRLIIDLKTSMPNAGYRIIKEALKGIGHSVQWKRVMASMHHVDTVGM